MTMTWTKDNAFSWAAEQDVWIYWDAADYFKAFIKACSQAHYEIFITGWDLHSETQLAPDWENSWKPRHWSLNCFLLRLLEEKPDLHIYLLCWDYAPIYLLEREKLQALRFGWFSHPRLHFKMDAAHPLGGSQHQKFVVVDGRLAFLGGMDLTIRRWDSCEHRAQHPWRRDPQGQPYGPYHDIQLGLAGSLVEALTRLFRERWARATGMVLTAKPRELAPLIDLGVESMGFKNVSVALSQTQPAFRDGEARREIAQLYADCLQAAQHHVILENQYLTSRHIVEVLSAVLQKERGPEVLIILPERAGGWLEKKTMGFLQAQALYALKQADPHQRLHIYAPVHQELQQSETYITVHSKVMVVDSRLVSVGSANLNNRSMGLDSECNASFQLPEPAYELSAQLLAHHSDAEAQEILPLLRQRGSLREAVELLNQAASQRRLQAIPVIEASGFLPDLDLVDAEQPSLLEEGMDRWSQVMQILTRRLGFSSPQILLGLGLFLALLLVLGYQVWQRSEFGAERLLIFFQGSGPDSWLRHVVIPLTFAIGGLLFIPINMMIWATAALLPLSQAVGHILLGILMNVGTCYAVGHVAGRFIFQRFFGRKARDILQRVGKGHFWTLVALRLVPLAPNSLINLTAGLGGVPFLRFLTATLVGMLPGLLLLLAFHQSLTLVLKKPEVMSVLSLVFLMVFVLLLTQWSMRRFSQYGRS